MPRYLDEVCDTCGGQKEMYYVPWCSKCERPEPKATYTLNFLQVVRHIERKYPDLIVSDEEAQASWREPVRLESHKDSLWNLISERISNDVYIALGFKMWLEERDDPDENGRYMSYDGSEDYTKGFELMQLIVDEYENEVEGDFDNVLWEISW